ncbi:MAG: ABC transporter permease [Planctomycetes bacterium]|nr:ABC transporter permease [Planctomycetota bacterium]
MLTALNPASNTRAFAEMFGLLNRHRALTIELTKRDIGERYAGQVLGSVWAIGHPIALMTIYVIVFTQVWREDMPPGMPLDRTAYLVAGIAPWMAFQESMMLGTTSITGKSNLVKQVVFPIEVLPIKGVLISLVSQLVMTALLLGFITIQFRTAYWTWALIPVAISIQAVGMAGVALFLSSVGVYFRDLKDFVQVFSTACMFGIPLFYFPPTGGPGWWIVNLNPFTHLLAVQRDVLFFGAITQPMSWVILTVLSCAAFCLGYRTFRRLKPMFGNVL